MKKNNKNVETNENRKMVVSRSRRQIEFTGTNEKERDRNQQQ